MYTNKKDVALLVHACDRYEFLFKGFDYFFSKYWNINVDCNYYFATEEKKVSINGFTNIQSGKGEWADRLSYLLKEKISEKYVLYFQEDMWINKETNPLFFNELFEFAFKNKCQQIKLHSSEVYKTNRTENYLQGFNIATLDNQNSDFLMSHQVTLWDRSFLIKQLKKNEHPWRNERKGTKRLKKLKPEIFHIDYFAENGNKEININSNPQNRSEYQTISINSTLNDNILPFIDILQKEGGLEECEYGTKLYNNYTNKLTHDGLEKPRKVDIIKRFKNWILAK